MPLRLTLRSKTTPTRTQVRKMWHINLPSLQNHPFPTTTTRVLLPPIFQTLHISPCHNNIMPISIFRGKHHHHCLSCSSILIIFASISKSPSHFSKNAKRLDLRVFQQHKSSQKSFLVKVFLYLR